MPPRVSNLVRMTLSQTAPPGRYHGSRRRPMREHRGRQTSLIFMLWKYAAAAALAVSVLAAAEHRGQVKFGGLPVPGAAVTLTQGDKKFTAVSDEQGVYALPNVPDGIW